MTPPERGRRRVDGARRIGDRCDSCERGAGDVVGPILVGINGWRTFEIDGSYEGRQWRASVLLCHSCAPRMEAFVAAGGQAGGGPTPPSIRTSSGGFYADPEWVAADVA